MKLPRHSEIWLGGYLRDRLARTWRPQPKRIWLAIADHYEPYWMNHDDLLARERVALWRKAWPEIAARAPKDSAERSPKYTFFYPEEEYRAELMGQLVEMVHMGIADVEVHLHHDGEGRQNFLDRMSGFIRILHERHGLLHERDGKVVFGFIHGNWALDNSLPNGDRCGLNDEITLLRDLGCYADFTMPSGNPLSQASMVNTIYWCTDDPKEPKSYDTGIPLVIGGDLEGDLLIIPGPLGFRWRGRLMPRVEKGELASYDPPTPYRAKRWIDISPRVGDDVFIKLFSHGTQERHSALLLGGALQNMYEYVTAEARRRRCEYYFVSTWEMFQAIDALRRRLDPRSVLQSPAKDFIRT